MSNTVIKSMEPFDSKSNEFFKTLIEYTSRDLLHFCHIGIDLIDRIMYYSYVIYDNTGNNVSESKFIFYDSRRNQIGSIKLNAILEEQFSPMVYIVNFNCRQKINSKVYLVNANSTYIDSRTYDCDLVGINLNISDKDKMVRVKTEGNIYNKGSIRITHRVKNDEDSFVNDNPYGYTVLEYDINRYNNQKIYINRDFRVTKSLPYVLNPEKEEWLIEKGFRVDFFGNLVRDEELMELRLKFGN